MSAKARAKTRGAHRLIEQHTGIDRAETQLMTPVEAATLAQSIEQEIADVKKTEEIEFERWKQSVAEEQWRRCECEDGTTVLRSNGSCECCDGFGSDLDEPMLEELGLIEEDEEASAPVEATSYQGWLRDNRELISKMMDEYDKDRKAPGKFDSLPPEARAFMKSISLCRIPGPGTMVIGNVKPVQKAGWRRMRVTVDSGAAESVIPTDEMPEYTKHRHPVEEYVQTATGEPIVNEGEQRLPILTPSGHLRGMTF